MSSWTTATLRTMTRARRGGEGLCSSDSRQGVSLLSVTQVTARKSRHQTDVTGLKLELQTHTYASSYHLEVHVELNHCND